MDINISLSGNDLESLPQPLKDALLIELQMRLQGKTKSETAVVPPAIAQSGEVDEDEEQPADLSVAQAKRFLLTCSPKTESVLRGIVEGSSREFSLTALATTLSTTVDDISWVWGGTTRRVRKILGDPKCKLVVFPEADVVYDDEDNWKDSKGVMSEMTYTSFRKVFRVQ